MVYPTSRVTISPQATPLRCLEARQRIASLVGKKRDHGPRPVFIA
jgi:hypothetical protein